LKPGYLVGILKKIPRDSDKVEIIPMVMNTILSDLIFEKFGVEEED
jgi:hypothetical protein